MARKGGPHPQPTNIRLLRGERKDRINTNEPQPPAHGVTMPSSLSPAAKQVWKRLAPGLIKKGLLTEWDRDAFVCFCEAVIVHREATKLMQAGMLVKTQAGAVKNPAWQLVRDSAQVIKGFAGEFGLTPSARSTISIPQEEGFEELAAILS